jgi:hypothetical protein
LSAVPDKLKRRNYGMIGSAGYLTTAIDLAQLQNALARERILRRASLDALWSGHGTTSIGEVGFGNFVIAHPALGLINSARGAEEWGDNAILNHYRREDTIVAVVTSRGPKEGSGDRFRDTISKAIEAILVP